MTPSRKKQLIASYSLIAISAHCLYDANITHEACVFFPPRLGFKDGISGHRLSTLWGLIKHASSKASVLIQPDTIGVDATISRKSFF